MLRFLTAGESHGQALVATLDGMPAGLELGREAIIRQLRRRQRGYGRGGRMAIERDSVEILSGVRRGRTLGTPICLLIRNRDWEHWRATMAVERDDPGSDPGQAHPDVVRPRPGHADLAGGLKYGHTDLRDVLERASARETAARVAVGACARQLLAHLGITVASHVTAIGSARHAVSGSVPYDVVAAIPEEDPIRCADADAASEMRQAIDAARAAGDTLGGTFEIILRGVPPGLGSYTQWDRRLDGRLAQALMSVPAIKAVEIGEGVASAYRPGTLVHDAIAWSHPTAPGSPAWGVARATNRAGGIEGGVSNGEEIRLTAYMKPIATLMSPLPSIDLSTHTASAAAVERSDVCAVPAAAVIGEAVAALVVADALTEKFGADSVAEIERNYRSWLDGLFTRDRGLRV